MTSYWGYLTGRKEIDRTEWFLFYCLWPNIKVHAYILFTHLACSHIQQYHLRKQADVILNTFIHFYLVINSFTAWSLSQWPDSPPTPSTCSPVPIPLVAPSVHIPVHFHLDSARSSILSSQLKLSSCFLYLLVFDLLRVFGLCIAFLPVTDHCLTSPLI